MVNGIPIYKVEFGEGFVDREGTSDKIFGYCIEANKGPVNEPIYVSTNTEALRIFGVNFAPHFYQKGAGIKICRVKFPGMKAPSLTYKAKVSDNGETTVDIIKITATTPGTAAHQVNIVKSPTSSKAYNLTVTIEGVGSKKYQNLSSLENVVKKINSKFAEYITAELLIDEQKALGLSATESLIKTPTGEFIVKDTSDVIASDEIVCEGTFNSLRLQQNKINGVVQTKLSGGSNGKLRKLNGEVSNFEIPDSGLENTNSDYTRAKVLTNSPEESFVGQEFFVSSNAIADGNTIYPLYIDEGETPAGIYVKLTPDNTDGATYAFTSYSDDQGTTTWGTGTVETIGNGDNDANVDATLLYAYREAFEIMENVDLLGLATLSNAEVVQNELAEHINKMIDPEVYKYRLGVSGYLTYPDKDSNGNTNASGTVDISDLTDSTTHIDNPFFIMIGQGVVFEEEGVKYNLLPHEAVQLYTGLRSALNYGESIFGGNTKKILVGVKDTLPLVTDGSILTKEDIESVNEAGLITFKKEYEEVTFLEGVTTAQDNPVLSHESVVMIVLNVLKRLIRVSKPFQGENVTEDLKTSLVNALSNELKNITDTDRTLVSLDDYNIPPYAVEVQATVIAGFNDAGEYIRESHYLVTVKIVPVGALRDITLSVIVI